MVYGAMAVGLPVGVTERDIGGPEPVTTRCACGCDAVIRDGDGCYRTDGGSLLADVSCMETYFAVEYTTYRGEG